MGRWNVEGGRRKSPEPNALASGGTRVCYANGQPEASAYGSIRNSLPPVGRAGEGGSASSYATSLPNPPHQGEGTLPLRGRSLRSGLSQVEVLVSLPLVAMVIVGAMNTTGGIVKTWTVAQDQHYGQALAENLMAEILQQPYEDPDDTPEMGREGGEKSGDRKDWDDVDDYDGWSHEPPEDKDKKKLNGFDDWTRAVTVDYVSLSSPTSITTTDEGLKRITVTVTDPAGEVTVLTAYRAKSGALEQAPLVDTTVQGYVAHELEVGSSTVYGGVHLPNHTEDE